MSRLRLWISKHLLVSSLLLLLVGASVFALIIRARSKEFGPVTEPIRRANVIESVYGIGTITARNVFTLKLGVTSTIRKLFVLEGDHVHRGQKLLALDSTGTPMAPFDGTITSLPVKAGETVFAQTPLLTLVDLSDRYVVVTLEQRGAIRVRRGQIARLSFDNMRDRHFEGEVESVYSNEGNFLVRIRANDLPEQLLPGMTADVALMIAEKQNVLVVPTAAVDSNRVYVKRGRGSPVPVEVRLGTVDRELAEIIAGDLHEGDRLAIRRKVSR